MSHLYLPWGAGERNNRLPLRNQFSSTLELHKQSSYEYHEPYSRQRSPSLPPIKNGGDLNGDPNSIPRNHEMINRNVTSKQYLLYDEDGEGDTSGYGSETINHRSQNDRLVTSGSRNPVIVWQQNDIHNRSGPMSRGFGVEAARPVQPWSSQSPRSAEDPRPKWGDKGVATGRLWEPTTPNSRLPQMQNQKKGTPSWVERGLNMIDNSSEVLVIDQSSNNSGLECDRSSCNGSDEGRSFLRGQNVPIEPEVKALRENQRIKALEVQSVILSQLEDREKRKQAEKEKRLQEERLEELRFQRQQQEDMQRLEDERNKVQEKQLLEQKRLETLKKALEEAEIKAKQEKEKRFVNSKQRNGFNTVNTTCDDEIKNKENVELKESDVSKSSRSYDVQSARSLTQKIDQIISQHTTALNSPRSMSQTNINAFTNNPPTPSMTLTDNNHYSIVPIGFNGEVVKGQLNCVQLAVLVPQNLNNSMLNLSLNSLNSCNEEKDKILTPRKYRSLNTKDVSTQTDDKHSKYVLDKTKHIAVQMDINIDENAPQESHNISKKERRFRSEERYKKELENRPKWGVNRPVAQYKKQSEKDPFYSQKRKIRHKYRAQPRQYVSQSSDDSRSPSPSRSDKINENNKHRNSLTQSYWRNKRTSHDYGQQISLADLSPNNSLLQNESLSSHINDIPLADPARSPSTGCKSPSKRITLSQKFINDKYGNRLLWNDDEMPLKNNAYDIENRKKYLDHINKLKRDQSENNEEFDVISKC